MESLIYWHVIVTKNSIRVSPRKTSECVEVKGSTACFTKREFAVTHANNKSIK